MAKTKNPYPTKRQEDALKDVLRFPLESLAQRSARLGVTRAGVHAMLRGLESKELAEVDDAGKWSVTLAGRKWLRPTLRSEAR